MVEAGLNGDKPYARYSWRLLFAIGIFLCCSAGNIQAQQTAAVHIQIQGAITRFLSADFPKNTFVAEGFGFFSATFLYRF
jgi:hypothetical protein